MANLVNTTLKNTYFLRELIGQGGMADVYLAWDKLRSSKMAVKVLHQNLASDTRFFTMFNKEAEFLRELKHPNIVRLYDFGQDGETVFIVMDYVDGSDLRRVLSERGQPFSLDDTSQVLAAVCKALHFAHQMKVYHCDIKPGNILFHKNETGAFLERDILLSDFGVSRWATESKGGGTPAYMAPELFSGASVSERTDIYALGITLYEMLSGGRLPFRGTTSNNPGRTPRERIGWEQANAAPPPLPQFNPTLPVGIVGIVEKALSKDPRQRFASALELWSTFESSRTTAGPPPDEQPVVVSMPTIPNTSTPPKAEPVSPPSSLQPQTDQQPYLVGIGGEKDRQVIQLPQRELTIGRSQTNLLRLLDRSVSRNHAVVYASRRAYYVRDENSSLGTFLNGRRLPPGTPILLKHGDRISIGLSQIFEFRVK